MINNPSITQSLCFKKLQILLFPIILSIPHDVYCSTVYLCTYEHFVFFGYYNIFLVSDSPAHDPLCTVEVQTVRDFTTLTKNTHNSSPYWPYHLTCDTLCCHSNDLLTCICWCTIDVETFFCLVLRLPCLVFSLSISLSLSPFLCRLQNCVINNVHWFMTLYFLCLFLLLLLLWIILGAGREYHRGG